MCWEGGWEWAKPIFALRGWRVYHYSLLIYTPWTPPPYRPKYNDFVTRPSFQQGFSMFFPPGLHFTNVFERFLLLGFITSMFFNGFWPQASSGLLWAWFFNGFSVLLLGGFFRASFLQCFSTLLLRIPPRASLSIWLLTCIQCSYGFSPLLPQAFSLGPGFLYYLQDRFSSLTASISITWFSMGLDSFWGRARLQSVIAHFVEPAECIFNFSELPYFQFVLVTLVSEITLSHCLSIFLSKIMRGASYVKAHDIMLPRILPWASF